MSKTRPFSSPLKSFFPKVPGFQILGPRVFRSFVAPPLYPVFLCSLRQGFRASLATSRVVHAWSRVCWRERDSAREESEERMSGGAGARCSLMHRHVLTP